MQINKVSRDKYSGHWWLESDNLVFEAYRVNRAIWELHGLYEKRGDKLFSLINYVKLDKSNVVYCEFNGHIVPEFCALRAMVNWVDYVKSGTPFQCFLKK